MQRIKVKVELITDKYYYETTETIRSCPECKKEFTGKKYCPYCKKETQDKDKEHTGWISEDLGQFSCSCIFGSWYRFGGKWKKNYPNSRCKHCNWSMREINNKDKIKFEVLDEKFPSDISRED